jgi:hypothetical protein
MKAEWAIALGAESPVLAVPWHDTEGVAVYIDLRTQPERIGEIPEARENPVLAGVLVMLGAPESPWATAKCDRWALDEDDLEAAALHLDLDAAQAGIGSYIDLYLRDQAEFTSLEGHRDLLERLTRTAEQDGPPAAMLELTLRHCIVEGVEGYAITAFLYAVGEDASHAQASWELALTALMQILLSEAAGGDRMKDAGE